MTIQNKGEVNILDQTYMRQSVRTHFVQRGEPFIELMEKYIVPHYRDGDVLFISEKVVSISQNRVVEKKDVEPGFWAKTLSKFVMKTPAGFSVGNVYKMQLAIKLAGLPRILFAAACSAITKPFGMKGVFYIVAGHDINGIDGFYGEAFEEYASLGILNPEDPDGVCQEIEHKLGITCAIVDANDIGCNVLGNSKKFPLSEEQVRYILKDNPAGQGDECTPFILLSRTSPND